MKKFAALSLTGLALASPALAEPLDRARIPAAARWLVHVDLEAAVRSQLFQRMLQNHEIRAELDEGLAEMRAKIGIDPLEDIHSITLFGISPDPENAVAIISASSSIDTALAMLPQMSDEIDVHLGTIDGREVYSIGDPHGDETWFVHVIRHDGAQRTLVATHRREDLGAAIDVIGGRSASLASARQPAIAARPGPGSILFAATADGLGGLAGLKPASQVARLAQSVVFDLGEHNRAIFARLGLRAATFEDATNMTQILQGAMALVNLATAQEQELAPFRDVLSSLRFETIDTTVRVDFSYDVDALLAILAELEGIDWDDSDGEVRIRERKQVKDDYEFEF